MAAFTSCGKASASTFKPTFKAVAGLTPVSMTSCMRSVSVQYTSSPNVSNRKMSLPCATRFGSSGPLSKTSGGVGSSSPHAAAYPALNTINPNARPRRHLGRNPDSPVISSSPSGRNRHRIRAMNENTTPCQISQENSVYIRARTYSPLRERLASVIEPGSGRDQQDGSRRATHDGGGDAAQQSAIIIALAACTEHEQIA